MQQFLAEVATLTHENVIFHKKEGSVEGGHSKMCVKSRNLRTTRVVVPAVGLFNTAVQLEKHLTLVLNQPRLWCGLCGMVILWPSTLERTKSVQLPKKLLCFLIAIHPTMPHTPFEGAVPQPSLRMGGQLTS